MPFNLNSQWTDADVAALLASVKDDRNWRLIVDKAGDASLLDTSANETPFGMLHCYLETWIKGNGYVGLQAAADKRHVSDTAKSLRENWPTLKRDAFIDS